MAENTSDNLLKNFDEERNASMLKSVILPAIVIVLIILAGGGVGYLLSSGKTGSLGNIVSSTGSTLGGSNAPKEAGVQNPTVYKDKTEGKLEVNDNKDVPEGSHKLIRPGGADKTAYLVSSVLDLNQYVGKCVEVQGETFTAQKAGWFMDVGALKVLDSCPSGI
jgi:hypothetical protein